MRSADQQFLSDNAAQPAQNQRHSETLYSALASRPDNRHLSTTSIQVQTLESSDRSDPRQIRVKRTCKQWLQPILLLALILLCAYCFFLLEVLQYLLYSTDNWSEQLQGTGVTSFSGPSAAEIFNWVLYAVFFSLTLWSLY